MLIIIRALGALLGTLIVHAQCAGAAEYPNRPVQMVVGFGAGGGTDIVARMLCEWLSQKLGQRFVLENRPGAGGNIATQAVINSPPDGYTLLFAGSSNAIATSLYKRLPFDFLRDTVPVAGVMRLANLMVVPPSLPARTVQEFIGYANAIPGKLSMASTGHGTSVHLSGELFKVMTKVDMVHVPYRGAATAYPDLITGKVHVLFGNLTGSIEYVREGRLRALGVTAAKRWDGLPSVATIAETVPGYEADVWYGVVAPKGTPQDIIAVVNRAINDALADPQLRGRFVEAGGLPMPMSPSAFAKLLVDDTNKWRT